MQEQNFNALMLGKDAKWAEKFDTTPLENFFSKKTPESKIAARAEIEKNEVQIPPEKQREINLFVSEMKKQGLRGRTIRRMVKRKFFITVI